jgi:hypothetical protein
MHSTKGFFKVHWDFFKTGRARDIGANAGWVLCALHSFANKEGECYPSLETLAAMTKLSIGTVVKSRGILKEAKLIDFAVSRDGKKNITHYRVFPLEGVDVLKDIEADANSQPSEEFQAYLTALRNLSETYPEDASYLKTNIQTLRLMKVPNKIRQYVQNAEKDLDNTFLYFALSLARTIRVVAESFKPPATIAVRGKVDALVGIANSMFKASEILDCTFESAASVFLKWVDTEKKNVSINTGVLLPISEEWVKRLRKSQ